MEGNVLKVYGTFIALRKPLHFFVSRLIRDFGGAVRSPRAAVLFCALASPGAGAVVVVVRVIRSARVEEALLGCSEWARGDPPPPPTTITLFLSNHLPLYNIIEQPFLSLFASCLASASPFSPPPPPQPPLCVCVCECVCVCVSVCAHSRAWFMYLSTSSSSPFHPTFAIPQQPLDGGGGGKPTAATRRWNWRRNFYLIPT